MDSKSNYTGIVISSMLSVLLIAIGALMFFVKNMQVLYFAYACALIFIIFGIIMISSYFLSEKFLDISNFDFTMGAMVIVVGCLIFIRSVEIVKMAGLFAGILIIVESVIIFQYAIMLKAMRGKAFFFNAISAVFILALGIALIASEGKVSDKLSKPFYILLIICGLLGLICQLIVAVRIKSYAKEYARANEQNEYVGKQMGVISDEDPQVEETPDEIVNDDNTEEVIDELTVAKDEDKAVELVDAPKVED